MHKSTARKARRTKSKVIYYKVTTDGFGEDGWDIDVIIQTEDPTDYADFLDAFDALIDCLRERIEDLGGDPDEDPQFDGPFPTTRLEKTHEMFNDVSCDVSDWDEYCMSVSQPDAFLGKASVNLAEVVGRKKAIKWLAKNPMNTKGARIKDDLARMGFPVD
jgi:hypothetical protein